MNKEYINKIINDDCTKHLSKLDEESIDLLLSDIPYGICLDDWDVLHNNTNSALLGQSPAQIGKSGFKRRGKPIRGWSSADRNIGKEYEEWCCSWASKTYPIMKDGASVLIFGARRTLHRVINAFEDTGFILKDVLAWKKSSAHHRAQRLNIVLKRRGLYNELEKWEGWRLGNLAPIYEPIAWFFKPYDITITDNILKYQVGAINIEGCKINGSSPTNLLKFNFVNGEERIHETQKPLELIKFFIKLTTKAEQIILDPFMGSGTTALAAKILNRNFIGFEINPDFYEKSIKRLKSFEYDYINKISKTNGSKQTLLFELSSHYNVKINKKKS